MLPLVVCRDASIQDVSPPCAFWTMALREPHGPDALLEQPYLLESAIPNACSPQRVKEECRCSGLQPTRRCVGDQLVFGAPQSLEAPTTVCMRYTAQAAADTLPRVPRVMAYSIHLI